MMPIAPRAHVGGKALDTELATRGARTTKANGRC
jgi:hypothetical protein